MPLQTEPTVYDLPESLRTSLLDAGYYVLSNTIWADNTSATLLAKREYGNLWEVLDVSVRLHFDACLRMERRPLLVNTYECLPDTAPEPLPNVYVLPESLVTTLARLGYVRSADNPAWLITEYATQYTNLRATCDEHGLWTMYHNGLGDTYDNRDTIAACFANCLDVEYVAEYQYRVRQVVTCNLPACLIATLQEYSYIVLDAAIRSPYSPEECATRIGNAWQINIEWSNILRFFDQCRHMWRMLSQPDRFAVISQPDEPIVIAEPTEPVFGPIPPVDVTSFDFWFAPQMDSYGYEISIYRKGAYDHSRPFTTRNIDAQFAVYDPEYVTRVYWARVTAGDVARETDHYPNYVSIYQSTVRYIRDVEQLQSGIAPHIAVTMSNPLRSFLFAHRDDSAVCRSLLLGKSSNEHGDYLHLTTGKISYLPTGRTHIEYGDGQYAPTGRMVGKPARIARKFLIPDALVTLTDKDFEVFANLVTGSHILTTGNFQIVSGQDIAYWYDGDRYADDGTGDLANSCMRGRECQYENFFGMYTDNPHAIRMLILTNEHDKLLGRALVWSTDCGHTLMDRVYGSQGTIEAFREYAESQEWSVLASGYALVDGSRHSSFDVTLKSVYFDRYPYMDTFTYLSRNGGIISTDNQGDLYLCNTNGVPDGLEEEEQEYRVEITRTVTYTERAYIIVTASDEDDAVEQLSGYRDRQLDQLAGGHETDTYDPDNGDWEVQEAELAD